MQKKLIALAIAGLSSAAFAQSNVTIYGVVDASFETVQASGGTAANSDVTSRTRVSSNSSYIGFKGEEALGNGLKGIFQLETGVNVDSGNGAAVAGNANTGGLFSSTGTRDTFVGIDGSFGKVTVGTHTTATRVIGNTIEFAPGSAAVHVGKSLFGEFNGAKTGLDDRLASSVQYVSPVFSGFQAAVAYGAGENQSKGKAWDTGITYNNGPLYIAYARAEQYNTNTDLSGTNATSASAVPFTGAAFSTATSLKNDRLGAKYNFGQGTVISALWDRNKQTVDNGTSSDGKRTAWQLGASHSIGAHTGFVEYTKAQSATGNNAANASGFSDTGAKLWSLGYIYNFSKRTLVKAYYSKLTNEANAKYDFFNNGIGANAGSDPRAIGVGLRHSF